MVGSHAHRAPEATSPWMGVGDEALETMATAAPDVLASSYQVPVHAQSAIHQRGVGQSGARAVVADPVAQKDFEKAKAELKGRFQIVSAKDAAKKGHAPNAITQADFDKIAQQFSDIRRGQTDLKFADDKDQKFKDGAMNDIAAILQTESGRKLIGGLANNVNEKTKAHRLTQLGATNRGHNFDQAAFALKEGTDNDKRNHKGTDMAVEYNAGKWTEGKGGEKGAPWMPIRSDVTLYHELTHALHGTHGWQDVSADEEEKTTVGLHKHELNPTAPKALQGIDEDTYRAERARIGEGKVGVIDRDKDMERRRGYGTFREKDKPAPKGR